MRVNRIDTAPKMHSDKIKRITYGWIRSNAYVNIKYVRCVLIYIISSYSVQVAMQEYAQYPYEQRVFFIDTKTTCGRTRGFSSDCDKDTTEIDNKLMNQADSYSVGLPLNSSEANRSVQATHLQHANEARKRAEEFTRQQQEAASIAYSQKQAEAKAKKNEALERLKPCIDELKSIGFTVEEKRSGYRGWGGRRTRSKSKSRKSKSKSRKTRSRV